MSIITTIVSHCNIHDISKCFIQQTRGYKCSNTFMNFINFWKIYSIQKLEIFNTNSKSIVSKREYFLFYIYLLIL